jgi:chromosome segregation ATPase
MSTSTVTSQSNELSMKSLTENISLILATVKGNTVALESLKSNIKAIEDNVKKSEEIVSESSKEVAQLKPRVQNVKLEMGSVKYPCWRRKI